MRICFCLLAALLLLPPVLATPSMKTITVGDPAHPEGLPAALQAAYAGGARRITIAPGTYTLPAVGHAIFQLDGWTDAAISAYGVTFVQTDLEWMHNLWDFTHCARVTLAGPTLTHSELMHYQGRITAVGADADGAAFCDWRPDAGYPVPPADATQFPGAVNIVDAHTRLLKLGVGDYYHLPMETRGDGAFRVHFKAPTLPFGVGDWIVGRAHPGASFKVFLNGSRDCVFRDITLLRSGFAPIREMDGGGNRFLHCRWLLGPRPPGATEDPVVSTAADGFHSTGTSPGPDMENCVFQGVFLDDCIAIHSQFLTVKSAAGRTLTLDGPVKYLAVGQPVRISNTSGFFGEAMVTALQVTGDTAATITLDQDLAVPVGAKLGNPLRAGAGYKIIGCHLGDTRSRGILAKADDGLILNNVITRCGMAAVSLGPEYSWNEANYARHVIVKGNTLVNNGGATYGGAAVLVHGDGTMGNRDILIQNNHFVSNYQGDAQIEWADGVTLTGNTFMGATVPPPAPLTAHSPIALANCRAITLRGNVVLTPANYLPVFVKIGDNVADVRHNDVSGVRAQTSAIK